MDLLPSVKEFCVKLKGITWDHSRGIVPLLAAAQRLNEIDRDIEIQWDKRTLQQFADQSLEELTEDYDLLIIDHPWVGRAAVTGCVLPLDNFLPDAFLDELFAHSVGASHRSYNIQGHQWALSIDAAAPTASYRADLLPDIDLPGTWKDVLRLASEGRVAVPAIPIDILMNFYTFCIAYGKEPFQTNSEVIDYETGSKALRSMRDLYSRIDRIFFDCNPIAVAEIMSSSDHFLYCPFAYNYSNYSRRGYSEKLLTYTDVVVLNGEKMKTTLGGTGIAISSQSKFKEAASRYLELICSPSWQGGEYVYHGGQPGYDYAWKDHRINDFCNDFFRRSLPVLDNAYMRPRYDGYLQFQDQAGLPVQEYMQYGKLSERSVLEELNAIYIKSLENL